MITPIDDTELAELMAELHRERFGPAPWRERILPAAHSPAPHRHADDPAVCAARRRELCLAIDGRYRNHLGDPVSDAA